MAAQLTAAVDSIPAFITACSEMWVLTPPVQHCDQGDVCCDFNTWRTRGWCRMEFAASKLATGDDKPVMLIGSPSAIENDEGLEYFQPCDIVKLSVAQGTFTQESDRPKVNKTIKAMLVTKLDAYEKSGNYTLMRLLLAFAPAFLPPEDAADLTLKKKARRPSEDSAPASAVDELKRRVRWRGDVAEAAWQNTSGWSLLTLAAALDDLAAVQELLRLPNAQAMLRAKGKAHSVPGHETFNKILHDYSTHITPLVAAATLASVPVLEALLDAGADMKGDAQYVFGEDACHLRGCVIAGKVENTKYLLTRYPEYVSVGAVVRGLRPAQLRHRGGLQPVRDGGDAAEPGRRREASGQRLRLHRDPVWHAMLYDLDPRVIDLLTAAGADVTEPFKSPRMLKFVVGGSTPRGSRRRPSAEGDLGAAEGGALGHDQDDRDVRRDGGRHRPPRRRLAQRPPPRQGNCRRKASTRRSATPDGARRGEGEVRRRRDGDAPLREGARARQEGPRRAPRPARAGPARRRRRGGATWAVVAVAAAAVAGGALLMARRRR